MKTDRRLCKANGSHRLAAGIAVLLGVAMLSQAAWAQGRARSGRAVVDTYCAGCHASGKDGAPRIGDVNAWTPRAAQGLSSLTAHALQGIRNMPPHGGSPALDDIEIERAITHMVNLSGGHWVEPLGGATPTVVRSGEQLVRAQCANCHDQGLQGAPKIGDRKAWTPRLAKGLDTLVKSAVHGHGGMPARGGLADATEEEIHGAIVYMFNRDLPLAPIASPAPAAAPDPYHRIIDGIEVYLGIVRAASAALPTKAAAPRGKDYYHVNFSLFDSKTKMSLADAKVMVKVADPISVEAKPLQAFASNGAVSYGGFFRMRGPNPYTITLQVERPGVAGKVEAKFDYRVW